MNINDLPVGSFKTIEPPKPNITNINQLQPGMFRRVENAPVVQPTPNMSRVGEKDLNMSVEQPGVLKTIGTDFGSRVSNVERIADEYSAGKVNLGSATLQTAGQAAAGLWDIVSTAVMAPLKELGKIKGVGGETFGESFSKGTEAALNQPLVGGESMSQSLTWAVDEYKKWKEVNPELAGNLEAVVNLSAVFPGTKGVEIGLESVGKVSGRAGAFLEKSAAKTVSKEVQNFSRELVRPIRTAAVKEAEVARTTEAGRGIFKRSVIAPTASELKAQEAVAKVPGISKNKTYQQNFLNIQDETTRIGKELEEGLQGSAGTWSKTNVIGKVREAEVPIAVRNIEGSKQVKDIEKYVGNLADKAEKNPLGAYKLSQEFRSNISKVYGENIWEKDTPIANYIRDVNRKLNDFVESVLPEGKTATGLSYKEAQAQRSALINAMDNIKPKAAIEADTAFGRFSQKVGKALGIRNEAFQKLAAVGGLGGLAAGSLAFAAPAAAIGVPLFLVWKGGKLIMRPEVRSAMAKVLKEIESLSKKATTPIKVKQLDELNLELKQLLKDYYKNPKVGLQLEDVSKKANPTVGKTVYKGEKDLTTKVLKDLEEKSIVSKQYIVDATNRGELKQVERDLIRGVLENEKEVVNVKDFAKKVKAELLPLKREPLSNKSPYGDKYQLPKTKYENIALPDELRGNVKNYEEQIYSSPIKTSAGSTHFGENTPNYFGHTRIEDMADNKTRRVIEVQSDLYQKGNLEKELYDFDYLKEMETTKKAGGSYSFSDYKRLKALEKEFKTNPKTNPAKLQQYNDPTAHFRMVREEIKKAAQDGKAKLQFPIGETAMKIEGLGDGQMFTLPNAPSVRNSILQPSQLKTGLQVEDISRNQWIITDVLGDGKFKAVSKDNIKEWVDEFGTEKAINIFKKDPLSQNLAEEFDISSKVDTSNPIYKFYNKEMQQYLKRFGGKRVVDDKGVEWIEVPIKKEWAKMPVEAFALLGLIGGASLIKK